MESRSHRFVMAKKLGINLKSIIVHVQKLICRHGVLNDFETIIEIDNL